MSSTLTLGISFRRNTLRTPELGSVPIMSPCWPNLAVGVVQILLVDEVVSGVHGVRLVAAQLFGDVAGNIAVSLFCIAVTPPKNSS